MIYSLQDHLCALVMLHVSCFMLHDLHASCFMTFVTFMKWFVYPITITIHCKPNHWYPGTLWHFVVLVLVYHLTEIKYCTTCINTSCYHVYDSCLHTTGLHQFQIHFHRQLNVLPGTVFQPYRSSHQCGSNHHDHRRGWCGTHWKGAQQRNLTKTKCQKNKTMSINKLFER